MFNLLLLACAGVQGVEPVLDQPRQGLWKFCWAEDADPESPPECGEPYESFRVIDDRTIDFFGGCAFDWPAVICWESRTTEDPSEYRDPDVAYPDSTDALLGYFLDTETFAGRRVEATTWTPLDERWEGGSLTRSTVTATWVSED